MDLAEAQELDLSLLQVGDHRILCPMCSHSRRNRQDRCLSVTVDFEKAVWNCWHCGWSGAKSNREPQASAPHWRRSMTTPAASISLVEPPIPVEETGTELCEQAEAWLVSRGLDKELALSEGVFSKGWSFPQLGHRQGVWFPYRDMKGRVYAHKIRTGESKKFSQAGGAQTFWRLDKVAKGEDLIVVEGELDALSMLKAGVTNVVSVPNGAPMKVSDGRVRPEEDRKFRYVWEARDWINSAQRIILAGDADEPGDALAEEIARRVGKAKCWRVTWPEGCKDANDVLVKHGEAMIKQCLDEAEPWPIAGVYDANHYADQVRCLFEEGIGKGESTGFLNVDDVYTVVPGHMTVVTGAPGSGKSSWINALMVNMASQHGWSFAVWSTEDPPQILIAKLAALKMEKPFFHTGPQVPRLTDADLDAALEWVQNHFVFLTGEGGSTSVEDVIDRLKTAVMRYGVRGAVIDPASYLSRPAPSQSEGSATDGVGQMLEAFKGFATSHDVSVWLVAHPFKMRPNADGTTSVPKGYDISGSAHWYNRPDVGLTIHRPAEARHLTEVHVWKMRYSWIGREGMAELHHDKATGRYAELPFADQMTQFRTTYSFGGGAPTTNPWDGLP